MRTLTNGGHPEHSWEEGTGAPVRTADLSVSPTSDCANSNGLTDATLIRRSQSGDTTAFAVLYGRHVAAVTAVCRTRVADAGAVEDLVQETFARLWAALPEFRGGDQVLHWLRRTAKNACVDHARRRCNAELSLVPAVAETARTSADPASDIVTRHAIGAVLAQLRPVDAALLEEHHLADRPLREMATRWGSTEKSLSVRLTRARRAFAAAGSDLRALLPLPLWLRLRWSNRADAVAAGGPVAAAVLMNAALTVLLVLPPAGAQEARQTNVAAVDAVVQAQEREAKPAPRVARHADAAARSGRRQRAERRAPTRAGSVGTTPDAIAEVPGAGIRLHNDAPENPDYHYRVEAAAGPVSGYAAVKTQGHPTADAVQRPACEAVAGAPAAATCTRDAD